MMATKKKAKRKATPKRKARKRGAKKIMARLEAELPANLREYVHDVESGLGKLEKRIEKAGTAAQRRALRLLRDAGKQLGRLEERGEAAWRKLTLSARKEAVALLDQLEAAIAPPVKKRKKKAARRRAPAKKA